jgi:hypothetical protein
MDQDNIIALVVAGLAFVASMVSVAVSLYNARLGRFSSERWWERKAEAYTRIVEGLSDLIAYYDRAIGEGDEPLVSSDEISRLLESYERGRSKLEFALTNGAFVISAPAYASLQAFLANGRAAAHRGITRTGWKRITTPRSKPAKASLAWPGLTWG